MAPKRPLSPPFLDSPTILYWSSQIEDRSSRFLAVYSSTLSAKELQAKAEFKTATHRIAAWRKPSSQRTISAQRVVETGHDDDGERYGGKALETVLTTLNAEGVVVVARWYGGVMLGPDRFDHIKNCAREAVSQSIQQRQNSAKNVKVAEDSPGRNNLLRILPARDQSISVLRDLLAEKQQGAASPKTTQDSPAKVPNYMALPLSTLQNLERARDATIGWILVQLAKAEEMQGELSGAARSAAEDSPKHCNDAESSDAPRSHEAAELADPRQQLAS